MATIEELLERARANLSRLRPELASYDRPVILMCDTGYQSSLAAATLRELGVDATDMIGGFQAWRDQGLPTA